MGDNSLVTAGLRGLHTSGMSRPCGLAYRLVSPVARKPGSRPPRTTGTCGSQTMKSSNEVRWLLAGLVGAFALTQGVDAAHPWAALPVDADASLGQSPGTAAAHSGDVTGAAEADLRWPVSWLSHQRSGNGWGVMRVLDCGTVGIALNLDYAIGSRYMSPDEWDVARFFTWKPWQREDTADLPAILVGHFEITYDQQRSLSTVRLTGTGTVFHFTVHRLVEGANVLAGADGAPLICGKQILIEDFTAANIAHLALGFQESAPLAAELQSIGAEWAALWFEQKDSPLLAGGSGSGAKWLCQDCNARGGWSSGVSGCPGIPHGCTVECPPGAPQGSYSCGRCGPPGETNRQASCVCCGSDGVPL